MNIKIPRLPNKLENLRIMSKEEYLNRIEQYLADGWISVDDKLPEKDGVYETIIHQGSITIKFSEPTRLLFRRGKFPRMDWNYVIFWKETLDFYKGT